MKAITLWSGKEVKSQVVIFKEFKKKEDDNYVIVENVIKDEWIRNKTNKKKSFKFFTFSICTEDIISSKAKELENYNGPYFSY